MNLFTELKRRHVFRIGIAYLVVAWLLTQVVGVISPIFDLPPWFPRAVIILLGIGFPVALILAWAFEITPAGVQRTETGDGAAPARSTTSIGRTLNVVIIGALTLAVVFLVWRQYYGAPSQTATQSVTATVGAMPSLAVLPFADFSPNKDQGYLADGLSDELMDKLAQLKGLALTGRTSAFAFKGKNEDLRTIGEKLGVENVLEGSLRKDGDQIRVTAQLINARTGYHLWSETYQRKFEDIFAIQDDISKSVANALQVALGVGDVFNVPGMTHNVPAYDEFAHVPTGFDPLASPEQVRAYVDHLERAVALDPNFANAWATLSALYRTAAIGGNGLTIEGAAEKAQQAFDRARKLAPDSPAVLRMEANLALIQGHWLDADRLFHRLLDQTADTAGASDAIVSYSDFLSRVGRMKEAVGYLEQARALDPLSIDVAFALVLAYPEARNYAAATAEAERGLKLDGDHAALITGMLIAAMAEGGKAEVEKWGKLDVAALQGGYEANIKFTRKMVSLLDDPSAAREQLRRDAADPANQGAVAGGISTWAAYYGDPQLSLDRFRKRPIGGTAFIWRVGFRDMRKLPGFKDLVRDAGLVDYWRKSGQWNDFCHPVGDNDFECE